MPPLGRGAEIDELVDHHLRAVDEVAVLRFPDAPAAPAPGCCSRTRSRSTAFSVSGLLWISNAARACGSACSGTCASPVSASWKHGVAMAEGAALDVLAGEADRRCRRRGSMASASSSAAAQSTVRSSGVVEHRAAPLAAALELAVHGEAVGQRAAATSLSARSRSSGTAVSRLGARRPAAAAPGMRLDEVLLRLERVERLLRARRSASSTIASAASGGRPRRASTSVVGPELAHGRVRGDLLVHQRLRERRLVAFVVAVAAVADEVDQEVALERARGRRSASRAASTHASGSSALTWTIGILKPRARPLAYDVLYASLGVGR